MPKTNENNIFQSVTSTLIVTLHRMLVKYKDDIMSQSQGEQSDKVDHKILNTSNRLQPFRISEITTRSHSPPQILFTIVLHYNTFEVD